eukprot:CAMPEP_0202810864 /NCGR_PEP_ID=MMETSP1389-20130828/2880_1 /ASSEMBLY_ACC=CAM_ASM_000865 /TAXON_ID=302021 /ORGANISM="Rhodomonas sp., Strain CCMP768" /LENGTH=239 /DNA_ID=CAMNT_0049481865 /DNA_START=95 /DNA_END=811 /DNA_ORIENTATION=+
MQGEELQHLALDLAVDGAEEVDVGADGALPVLDKQRQHLRLRKVLLLHNLQGWERGASGADVVDDGDDSAREVVVTRDQQEVLGVALRQRVHVKHLLEEGLGEGLAEPQHHRIAVLDQIRPLGLQALRGEAHGRGQGDFAVTVVVTGAGGHVVEGEHAGVDEGGSLACAEGEEALAEEGALVGAHHGRVERERLVLEQRQRVERQQLERLRQDQLPRRRVGRAELAVHKQDLHARRHQL